MEEVAGQAAILAIALAAAFVGPGLALAILLFRRKRVQAQRRSPIAISLLRSPGHTLRQQLDNAMLDVSFGLMALASLPLILLTMFLLQAHLRGTAAVRPFGLLHAALAALTISLLIRKLWATGTRLDALRAGYDAELAVGQELDQLMRQGAIVFHDVPGDGFNVDHVVIAAKGVFAVETKGFTKPKRGKGKADATVEYDGGSLKFPLWASRKPLEQAERQARWLSDWLSSAMVRPVRVQAVLALPGWFVHRTGNGHVWVFSGKELTGLLTCRDSQRLSEQDIKQLAYQVEQRCRTVSPTYAADNRPPDIALGRTAPPLLGRIAGGKS